MIDSDDYEALALIKKRVAVLPWPTLENCFLCVSGAKKNKEPYGHRFYTDTHREHIQNYESRINTVCEPRISFVYKGDHCAAEWDGRYGPIQMWFECEKDFKDEYQIARPHWIFDYCYGSGHWSQLAVDDNHLSAAFNRGDYNHIFHVLKGFVGGYEKNDKCD
jgi:hypothetical protein